VKETTKNTYLKYLGIIVKWRLFIVKLVITITVLAIIISLLLVQKYTATATILPPSSEQETMIGMISSNLPGGLSGLGRMTGMIPGVAAPSELFAAIMKSGRIKGEIIREYDLMKEFKARTMTDAGKQLDEITTIEVSPEGIISVSVIYKNKYLATDIANAYVERLDKFNTETAMTVGKRYRMFIEQRLQETEDSLEMAEQLLRDFQEKHRTVALNAEIESAIETIATLKSEILLLEVKKGAISSSSQINNPYLHSINRELRELKRQLQKMEFGSKDTRENEFGIGFFVPISKLPEIALEYARLLRDVKVQEAVYGVLTQQYEQAKIMELKDTPSVQFLQRASPPEKKSFPRRGAIVVFSTVAAFLIGIFLAFFLEYYQRLKQVAEWQDIYNTIGRDLINIKRNILKLLKR